MDVEPPKDYRQQEVNTSPRSEAGEGRNGATGNRSPE